MATAQETEVRSRGRKGRFARSPPSPCRPQQYTCTAKSNTRSRVSQQVRQGRRLAGLRCLKGLDGV